MRCAILTLALLGCGAPPAEPVEPRNGAHLLIGVVAQHGTLLCDGSERGRWVDRHHQIGFVRVVVGPDMSAMEGRPVVAVGRPVDPPPSEAPEHTGPCPMPMQMRADWVEGPGGLRVKRAEPPFPAFEVYAVQPFEGLETRFVDGTLRVGVHNTLERPLRDLRVVVYYEGCHGKPETMSRTRDVGPMAPGDGADLVFPAQVRAADAPPGRQGFRAQGAGLETTTPGVTLHLNVATGSDGSPCPS